MSCHYPRAFTDKYFRKQAITKSYKPKSAKDVTIIGQPIEITHLNNFKVDITFPSDFIATIDERILNEFLNGEIKSAKPKRCNCASTDLFRHGCQCGGK
jgi:hypothetical protein